MVSFLGIAQDVNTWGPESVTNNYFQRGHTFIAAGGIHRDIGKLFRKTSIEAIFEDFVKVCNKTDSKIEPIILDLPFIYQISNKSCKSTSTKAKMPLLEKIVAVQFKKDVI